MLNTNITSFRKNVFSMLEQTIKYNEPLNISTKAGNAVVLSEEDYRGMIETLNRNGHAALRVRFGGRDRLVMYKIVYTKAAAKDVPKLKAAHLDGKVKALIEIIKVNPFQNPPSYEKLVGDLSGLYSRRINAQHRLVYEVVEEAQTIKILSMWSHYERL